MTRTFESVVVIVVNVVADAQRGPIVVASVGFVDPAAIRAVVQQPVDGLDQIAFQAPSPVGQRVPKDCRRRAAGRGRIGWKGNRRARQGQRGGVREQRAHGAYGVWGLDRSSGGGPVFMDGPPYHLPSTGGQP